MRPLPPRPQLIWVIPLLGLLACLVPSASSAKPAHLRLHSSHVVVVGGSTGLTRAVVLEAVQQGADVTLLAPEGNSLHAVYEEMKLTSMDRLDRSKTATSKAEQRKQQLRSSPTPSSTHARARARTRARAHTRVDSARASASTRARACARTCTRARVDSATVPVPTLPTISVPSFASW